MSSTQYQFLYNTPLSNYASVPANNNLKSRLVRVVHLLCFLAQLTLAETSGCCSRELKRNSKVGYSNGGGNKRRTLVNDTPVMEVEFYNPFAVGGST